MCLTDRSWSGLFRTWWCHSVSVMIKFCFCLQQRDTPTRSGCLRVCGGVVRLPVLSKLLPFDLRQPRALSQSAANTEVERHLGHPVPPPLERETGGQTGVSLRHRFVIDDVTSMTYRWHVTCSQESLVLRLDTSEITEQEVCSSPVRSLLQTPADVLLWTRDTWFRTLEKWWNWPLMWRFNFKNKKKN